MPRNGAGDFSFTDPPVVSGTPISTTVENARNAEIAAALTASIAKDGQTVPTADLPMGSFRHTNVGSATLRTHYATAGQVQDGAIVWGGTATYTTVSNVYAITLSPTPAAYAAGQTITFMASNANVGSNAELNINSLSKQPLRTHDGRTLRGGEIRATSVQRVVYTGAEFRLPPIPAEEFIESQTASNSATIEFNLPPAFRGFNLYFDAVTSDGAGGDDIRMYGSIDNGSSWQSNYDYAYTRGPAVDATATSYTTAAAAFFLIAQGGAPASNASTGASGRVLIYPGTFPTTKRASVLAQAVTQQNTGQPPVSHDVRGRFSPTIVRTNRIRVQLGSSLLMTGAFTLTGLRG